MYTSKAIKGEGGKGLNRRIKNVHRAHIETNQNIATMFRKGVSIPLKQQATKLEILAE